MQELQVLARAVAPVVVVLVLGRLLARWGLITAVGAADLNRLVYWVGLPAQLIVVVAASDLRQAFDPAAVGAAVLSFVIVLGLTLALTRHRTPAERGSLASGVARANAAYVGLPVVTLAGQALGDARGVQLLAVFTVVLAVMVPVFNIGSVLGFVVPQHGLLGGGWRRSLCELPRNPLIIACLIGIALAWFTPGRLGGTLVGDSLLLVAQASLPLALLVTGAALDLRRIRAAPFLLTVAALGKLVLAPALTAVLAWAFGAGAIGIAAAAILMACPTAVANVPMARQLGGDEALMAAQVVLTTVIAPVSLVLWMVVLV